MNDWGRYLLWRMPAGSSAVRLWIMDSRDYMVLARFWLGGRRLSRSASQRYGRHIVRFKAWCEASNVERLALLSDDLVRYYDWMERKPAGLMQLDDPRGGVRRARTQDSPTHPARPSRPWRRDDCWRTRRPFLVQLADGVAPSRTTPRCKSRSRRAARTGAPLHAQRRPPPKGDVSLPRRLRFKRHLTRRSTYRLRIQGFIAWSAGTVYASPAKTSRTRHVGAAVLRVHQPVQSAAREGDEFVDCGVAACGGCANVSSTSSERTRISSSHPTKGRRSSATRTSPRGGSVASNRSATSTHCIIPRSGAADIRRTTDV